MMMNVKRLVLVALLIGTSLVSHGQMQFNTELTIEDLVVEYFNSGALIEISNVTFNGMQADQVNVQLALFSNGLEEGFPIDSGMVMTTGNVEFSLPNPYAGWIISQFEDADLNTYMEGYSITDCAVLEFDVTVLADALVFNYAFASHEYDQFTCSAFNDIFGLFVSGPGIDGSFSNEAENIATIPNSEIPVMINTVNSGEAGIGALVDESYCLEANPNWQTDTQYFNENSSDESSNMNMNGFTDVFQAYSETIYGETYHLKFAICDVFDGVFDSAVFFGEGTLQGIVINKTEDLELKTLSLFPNPAASMLTIELEESKGQTRFDILDIQGRLIRSVSANGQEQVTIPVQELDLGFYVINQYTEDALVARAKFVKE